MSVRIGVIGTGRWAALHHIPAILADPRAEFTALVEPRAGKRALAQRRFGVPRAFAGHDELFADDLVDAVVIASPPAAHHAAAAAALRAGKHVLVEKPMTIDPADAWDLVDLADATGVHLLTGYTFQFTDHALPARRHATAGIGELQLVSGLYASPASHLLAGTWHTPGITDPLAKPEPETFSDPAVSGGGQATAQLTHALANIAHTTGRPVRTVAAQMRGLALPVDVADALLLELDGGAIVTLASVGSLHVGNAVQWEFRYYGSSGYLLQDLDGGTLTLHRHDGTSVDEPPLPADRRYPAGSPVRRLIDLILGGGENPAPGWLGAHVVEVIAAAYRSAANGGTVQPVAAPPDWQFC